MYGKGRKESAFYFFLPSTHESSFAASVVAVAVAVVTSIISSGQKDHMISSKSKNVDEEGDDDGDVRSRRESQVGQ